MNTIQIGKRFEKEAFEYLKDKFESVEWIDQTYDFLVKKDNKEFYVEAKIIGNGLTGNLPRLRYTQQEADFLVTKVKDKIILFDKEQIKNQISIEKRSLLIKLKAKTIMEIEKFRIHPRETWDDIVNRIIKKCKERK